MCFWQSKASVYLLGIGKNKGEDTVVALAICMAKHVSVIAKKSLQLSGQPHLLSYVSPCDSVCSVLMCIITEFNISNPAVAIRIILE